MEKRTIVAMIGFFAVSICAFFVTYVPDHREKPETKPRPLPEIKASSIESLEVSQPGNKERVVLVKKGDDWQITSPIEKLAEQNLAKTAVETLEKLKFVDITSEKKEQFAELEVSEDKAIHVIAKDKSSNILADLYVGKNIGSNTIVRLNGKDEAWKVTGLSNSALKHDIKDWRNHNLFDIKTDLVEKVTLEGAGQIANLERLPAVKGADGKEKNGIYEAKWKLLSPEQNSALQPITGDNLDDEFINRLVSGLASLRADDFDDQSSPEHLKELGLAPASSRMKIFLKEGKSAEILVGVVKDGNYYVKTAESPQIFVLQKSRFESLDHPPKDVLDKTLVSLKADQIQKISIVQGTETLEFQATDKGWRSPQISDLDEKKVQYLVNAFEKFAGERFVEVKDPILPSLQQPKATITIQPKDGVPIVLKIGETKEGKMPIQKVGVVNAQPDAVWVQSYIAERVLKKPEEWKKTPPPSATAPMPPKMPMPMPSG